MTFLVGLKKVLQFVLCDNKQTRNPPKIPLPQLELHWLCSIKKAPKFHSEFSGMRPDPECDAAPEPLRPPPPHLA